MSEDREIQEPANQAARQQALSLSKVLVHYENTDTGSDDADLELTILMPCLNESETLETCIRKAQGFLEANQIRGEIVVGDNGSTDGSQEVARRCRARVVDVPVRGYGAALIYGSTEARGKYIIMGDSDDSYDFSDLLPFVEKLRAGYDVVIGNRLTGGIKPGAMPWKNRWIGTPALSAIGRILFRCPVIDFNCGLRGFSVDAFRKMKLRTTGMEFASEFVIKATQLGARMTEIPITLWADKRGRPPHLRSFRDGWRHLRFMLLYTPNWLFLLPGASFGALGLFLVLWLLPGPRTVASHVVLDVHTMIFGVIFTLLGAQIVSIGLFAKVFSYCERFDRGTVSLKRVLRRVTLESGLLLGGALFLAGFAGCAWVTWRWAASGFGELHEVRQVLFWSMWLFLGLQVIFASFFLSMLGISRGTYIGDYELK